MYVDTPYTRFKSLMPKTSLPRAFKTRNMYRICCKKYIYSLFSAINFRNLQEPDWLQDRIGSWLIKRATSLLNSVCSNVAKEVARLCRPSYPVPMPSLYQISIVQCPYPYKDDLRENFGKNHCRRMRNVHFRLACVAQKEKSVKGNLFLCLCG